MALIGGIRFYIGVSCKSVQTFFFLMARSKHFFPLQMKGHKKFTENFFCRTTPPPKKKLPPAVLTCER